MPHCPTHRLLFAVSQRCALSLAVHAITIVSACSSALGHTVEEIKHGHAICNFPKTKFSMLVPEVSELLAAPAHKDRQDIVLFGIEVNLSLITLELS